MNPTSPETIFRLAGVTAAIEVFRARSAGTPPSDVGHGQRSVYPRPGRRAPSPPLTSPPPPALIVVQRPAPSCAPPPPRAHLPPFPRVPAWPDHLACMRLAEQVRAEIGAAGGAWTTLCGLLARGGANGLTLGVAAHALAWQMPDVTAEQRQEGLAALNKALRSTHLFACPWAAFGLLAHGGGAGLTAVQGAAARLVDRLADDLDEATFLADTLRLEAFCRGVMWRLWVADKVGENTREEPLASLPGLRRDLGLVLDRSARRHAARRGGLPLLAGDLAAAWAHEALACVLCLFPAGPGDRAPGPPRGAVAAAAAGMPSPSGPPPAAEPLDDELQALWQAAEASREAHHGLLPLLPTLDEPRRSFAEALAGQCRAAAQRGAPGPREAGVAGVAALAQRVADRLCPRLAARPHRRRRDLL